MTDKFLDTIIRNPNPIQPKPPHAPIHKPKNKDIYFKKNRSAFIRFIIKKRTALITALSITLLSFYTLYSIGKPLYDLSRLAKTGRYLLLFQNNAELRGGGGFLGSFAVIDIYNKKVIRYYFEANIYKKDNEFARQNRFSLPDYFIKGFDDDFPLAMRDANYPADFKESAQSVKKFYEMEYRDRINGIIAINASAIKDLIKITGPLSVSGQTTAITSEIFFDFLQREIQNSYFDSTNNKKINEPKTVLKDLVSPLLAHVKKNNIVRIYHFMLDQIANKQIIFWFDDSRQALVEKNNWAGRVRSIDGMSLLLSSNNIGGGKSSLNVNQEVAINTDGRNASRGKLTITRTHQGETFYESGLENKNYLKIVMPVGTKYDTITLDGQMVKEEDAVRRVEAGKSVLGVWMNTKSNTSKTLSLDYHLPEGITHRVILYQKQPGVIEDKINVMIGSKLIFTGNVSKDTVL